ncbi:hypothetical protein ACQ4N7_30010 [Nodosilinea sp. AN01ver1]|uniref:hypothetical protein n=1 Tax=Nodosilinea sp. AN01ver1 TaxID=3423362 RepID=UPI003D319D9D
MPTQTLNKREATTLLIDAQQQHEKLAAEFSKLQSHLSRLQPGSEEFTVAAHRAADMRTRLQGLTEKIQSLHEQATSEAERQAAADRRAAAEAAQAAAEQQGYQDMARIEESIAKINASSDALAAAIAEYESLRPERERLVKLGWLKFDSLNRSIPAIVRLIPYLQRRGSIARLMRRSEARV